ncbi:hypothetical protein SAMN05421855_10431 [Ulvibacter litoralis]|uniref:YhhN-like protein n=3 Tax=Ulvibacter litoralis TaxID=227084 RepID=A0A1G7HDG7_9FLAO|nr:hypothetical protein SAMN05421855_10431 [Ulvibacter litoralis]
MFYPFLYLIGFTRNSKAYKIFTLYLIGIGIIQFLMGFVRNFLDFETNLFLFKYYFIFQFLMLSYFYKTLLGYRWVYFMTSIALLFFIFQYIDDPELSAKYNPLGSAIAQIIIVIYSLLYFYRLLSAKGEFLIVNIGVFFYMLISILIFAAGNLVFVDEFKSVSSIMRNLNAVFYFVFQVLILLEWGKNYYKKKNLNG